MTFVQVLRLISFLVKFGYYGSMEDIHRLLKPLMGLLDGKNDVYHSEDSYKKEQDEDDMQASSISRTASGKKQFLVSGKYGSLTNLQTPTDPRKYPIIKVNILLLFMIILINKSHRYIHIYIHFEIINFKIIPLYISVFI